MKSWTPEEDEILQRLYAQIPSFRRWKNITIQLGKLGVEKTQYQCRDRSVNKLDPEVDSSDWCGDQVIKIFGLYNEYGSQWSLIQKSLSGRTQNSIKNKFYCTIRNFLRALLKVQKLVPSNSLVKMSSKKLTDLYQGKKWFLKRVLKSMGYKVEQTKVQQTVDQEPVKVRDLCALIFAPINDPKNEEPKKTVKVFEMNSNFKKYVPEGNGISEEICENQSEMTERRSLLKTEIAPNSVKKEFPASFSYFEGVNSKGNSLMDDSDLQNFSPPLEEEIQYNPTIQLINAKMVNSGMIPISFDSLSYLSLMLSGRLNWQQLNGSSFEKR